LKSTPGPFADPSTFPSLRRALVIQGDERFLIPFRSRYN
jgi:hypothetical protein